METANEKVKETFFREPAGRIYGVVPVHMQKTPHASDQPRSASTSCFSNVVMCSAAPKLNGQQKVQEPKNRRPDMCLLCLCPLIAYTVISLKSVSVCVVWSCCVSCSG